MNEFNVSRADNQTICKEIGERLQDSFKGGPLPPPLRLLIDEIAKADRHTHQVKQ